jgi:hypothetical protein
VLLSLPKGKSLSTIRVIREDVKIRGLFLRLVFVCPASAEEYESQGPVRGLAHAVGCPILRVFCERRVTMLPVSKPIKMHLVSRSQVRPAAHWTLVIRLNSWLKSSGLSRFIVPIWG